jgi:hypothetical protein
MKTFDLKKYTDDNYYMVCETVDEAEMFCRFLDKHERTWCDGMSYTTSTDFDQVDGAVAYYFNYGTRGAANNVPMRFNEYRLNFSDFEWEDAEKIKNIKLAEFEDLINV